MVKCKLKAVDDKDIDYDDDDEEDDDAMMLVMVMAMVTAVPGMTLGQMKKKKFPKRQSPDAWL